MLSDEQIAEMMRETWGCASIAPRHAMGFARAIEAEVRKHDDALIQQMKEVLESLAGVKLADGSYADKDCGFTLAITAAKLRLGG